MVTIIKPKHFIFLFFFAFLGIQANAQFKKNKSAITGQKFKIKKKKGTYNKQKPINFINNIQGTFGLGLASYYGELCDGMDCLENQSIAINLGAQYRISPHLSARSEIGLTRLSASDEGGKNAHRNLSFTSNNIDLTVQAVYDLFAFRKMHRRRKIVTPYFFAGIGLVYFNPQAELNGTSYTLADYKTEANDYSNMSLTLPFGVGLRFKASPHIEIGAEGTYFYTFTDYLDNVSTTYHKDINGLSQIDMNLSDRGPELGRKTLNGSGQIRGNPDSDDGYFVFQVKVHYTLKITKQHYNINSNVSRFRMINNVKKRR